MDYCRERAAVWSNSWWKSWSVQIDSYSSCPCEEVLILKIAIRSCNSIRIKYESQENAQKCRTCHDDASLKRIFYSLRPGKKKKKNHLLCHFTVRIKVLYFPVSANPLYKIDATKMHGWFVWGISDKPALSSNRICLLSWCWLILNLVHLNHLSTNVNRRQRERFWTKKSEQWPYLSQIQGNWWFFSALLVNNEFILLCYWLAT